MKYIIAALKNTYDYIETCKGMIAFFTLGQIVWYVIISFINNEWNPSDWYLYQHGWGRVLLVFIEIFILIGALKYED